MPRERKPDEEGTTWGAARVLDVLEFLGRRTSPAPASIIASSCHIPRSSTYGLLNLLKERRFVTLPRRRARLVARLGGVRAQRRRAALRPRPRRAARVRHVVARPHRAADRHAAPACRASPSPASCRTWSRATCCTPTRTVTYSLGLELVSLASRVGWVDRLRIAARAHLVRLRDATSETANLIVLDGDHAIYVDQVESSYALRHSGWVGRRVPLAGTATGAAFDDRTTLPRRQGRGRDRRHLHRLRHRPARRRRRRRHHRAELAHRGVRRRARAADGRGRGAGDLPARPRLAAPERRVGEPRGRRTAPPAPSLVRRARQTRSRTSLTAPPASGA